MQCCSAISGHSHCLAGNPQEIANPLLYPETHNCSTAEEPMRVGHVPRHSQSAEKEGESERDPLFERFFRPVGEPRKSGTTSSIGLWRNIFQVMRTGLFEI
jgi:hypothetical protein